MLVVFAIAAVCLSPPVDGPLTAGFAPTGPYSGLWGVRYAAQVGDPVRAPASGTVSFAGSVAGMRTMTIEPVPGLKVSLSYLSEVLVSAGSTVSRGSVVARAGAPQGVPGVHMSTRINGRYVDPAPLLGCRNTDISEALWLVEPPRPYPRGRAHRNTRRDLRPDTRRPSPHRGVRSPSAFPRPGLDHSRR